MTHESKSSSGCDAHLFRTTAPAPQEPRPYHFPDVERMTFKNGLRLLIARTKGAPVVSIRALIHAGADHDEREVAGIASVTADMLDEGAAGRTAMEIAEEVADFGGALYSGADWDASFVAMDLLSKYFDEGAKIFADVLLEPEFPAADLDRILHERLTAILQEKDEASVIASNRFSGVVFEGTTYANPLIGTDETVRRINRERVVDFYRRNYMPNNTSIIIAGDVDPAHVREVIESRFSKWERKLEPPRPAIAPRAGDATRVYIVDRPQAVQSEIRVGHVGVPRSTDDYFPLVLMNAILGGIFMSRLNLNLREKNAFTYGIRSAFGFRRHPGPFVVSTAVRNEVTRDAVREILGELQSIREGDVTDRELSEAKNFLMGVFPATVQGASDLASRIQEMELYSLPSDYFDKYREMMAAVTAADIARVAKKYINPGSLAIVVVGKAAEIEEPLAELAHPVGIVDLEGRPVVK